ncbi:MAG: ATP-binding protein [Flammeovirgaceae bacterium]
MIDLKNELDWFELILKVRFRDFVYEQTGKLNNDPSISAYQSYEEIPLPILAEHSPYTQLINRYQFNLIERACIILALLPHIKPQLLDIFFTENALYNRTFTQFGGYKGIAHKGFLPTGETAAFIFASEDLEKRKQVIDLFSPLHAFNQNRILKLGEAPDHEPALSGPLLISPEYLSLITIGKAYEPPYSSKFPAKKLTSALDWEDLIIPQKIRIELEHLLNWLKLEKTLMHGHDLVKRLRPGYRAMFYGEPGTGKTLAVTLLGKATGRSVYRVDLSQLVSKYIGETEKNLANVFDMAEGKNWILFFDEGDVLFGKRTETRDSNDKHANQQTAYLLQRIESFTGLFILATNRRIDIDSAFSRRFESIIHFFQPGYEDRLQLWKGLFNHSWDTSDIDWEQVSADFLIPGGMMVNVLRYVTIKALARNSNKILPPYLLEALKKEYEKAEKAWPSTSKRLEKQVLSRMHEQHSNGSN